MSESKKGPDESEHSRSGGAASAKTILRRDQPTLDAGQAYVPCTAVLNVFSFEMARLDRELWPRGGRDMTRDEVLAFVENLKYALLSKHSRRNPDPQLARPGSRAASPPVPATNPADISTDSRAEWLARRGGRRET